MNTLFLVMAQFESAEIPLDKLCDQFGLGLPQAKRKAALHELPVPFYKKTSKGGYFCSAKLWAEYLDKKTAAAQIEWQRMNKHNQGARA
jgi:hypothetical protein